MHVQLRLITQPFHGHGDVVEFLNRVVDDPDVHSLDIVVAWAKRSGFNQILAALRRFRGRGGRIRMIVGISQGGATEQGLLLTMAESDEPYVFHDPSGRTFHPKLYYASGSHVSYTLIGSQNLTRGGVIENFEIGVEMSADRNGDAGDIEFIQAVEASISDLLAETQLCLPLTQELLDRVRQSPTISIADEDNARQQRPVDLAANSDEASASNTSDRLFGRAIRRLKRAMTTGPLTGTTRPRGLTPSSVAQPGPTASTDTEASVVRRWFKQMKSADAQRLPGTSNPSGHLTLTKAGHPIEFSTYFRDIFFGGCDWQESPGGRGREMCPVSFIVEIAGEARGIHTLHVDHNPGFASNQRNRVTTLRWGDVLNHHMRYEANHVDDYITLEALSDGNFRLIISSTPIGDFVY